MKKEFLFFIGVFWLLSCKREFDAPVPNTAWELFASAAARPLPAAARLKTEGVYAVEAGAVDFGPLTAAHWSYTAAGADTLYRLSFFVERAAAYFICEGRQLDSSLLLNGYWRRMTTAETGRVRLTIARDGGRHLLLPRPFNPATDSIVVSGTYGFGEAVPDLPIRLRYLRPLNRARPFHILAHRGGGRTADLLPASENSVNMIRLAPAFGATGVETDVRLTKDGVPILFHDNTLNERVVQKNGLLGPVENYTYDQLYALVRLPRGERIPTLREALHAVVYNTPLEFVWLDIKYDGSLQAVKDLQTEFLAKAAAINRRLEIVIGIPDETALANFKKLPGYQNTPSLVELKPDAVRDLNARVWAPQWTLGLQTEETRRMQAEGRRVFTWTMDVPENVQDYMRQGTFNGILSNLPSITAYYYYVAP